MNSHVLLGMKVEVGANKRVKIDNFSLDNEVKNLKEEASKQSNKPVDILELIYHGIVLDEEKCLKDYGIKSGEMVHVFKKVQTIEKPVIEPKTRLTAGSINLLFKTYGLPTRSVSSFSNAMEVILSFKMFCEASSIEKILEIEPQLAQDPVALSYLTVPELVFHLQDVETFDNIMKKHPLLVPTFVKVIKGLQSAVRTGRQLFSDMHADSDEDEDVDVGGEEEGEDEDEAGPTGGLITPEQLSAALAMAGATAASSAAGTSASSAASQDTGFREFLGSLLAAEGPQTSGAAASRPLITSDMFSNALSQAYHSSPGATASSSSISVPAPDPATSLSPAQAATNFTEQLASLREMGLDNHRVNMRALLICSGDVHAAINLILSGAIPDA